MAMIDYGAVVFKNGVCQNPGEFIMDMQKSVGWSDSDRLGQERTDGNFMVYAGDEHLTVATYKYFCRVLSEKSVALELWGSAPLGSEERHKTYHFSIGGTLFCLRALGDCGRVLWLQFSYKGDHYNVVYGYGIDPDPKVWNAVKVRYLGKKLAQQVDRLYGRILSYR